MKTSLIGIGIVVLGAGMALGVTNPSREQYRVYAGEILATHLKEEVCTGLRGGQDLCQSFVEESRPQIEQIIDRNTNRDNFFLFSIYRTELSLPIPIPGIPTIQAETIGGLTQFYTYELEEI
ncbi:DUF4359 domain-containing protein [Phormidium yuhuli AB48]|uniref:DUF4359 domain-containing protein n=1 Tax=Phormidium yuhuli AB48 TaxID=2940671 RepID=A0ABY5AS02_9CYAN|nr:DUF4359 domain-containing protein [Phormidium yuhuli]USR91612.1 DUF4359 domain-containing protein [Phormidium yuhuli AB48]